MKNTVITILATLGVIFIIVMLIPVDDDEESSATVVTAAKEASATAEIPVTAEVPVSVETPTLAEASTAVEVSPREETTEQENCDEDSCDISEDHTVNVDVHIPEELLSDDILTFRTTALDGTIVTQDVFADYDITIVHVWGTYCESCVDEMKNYASFAGQLPSNVNLIGIVCDVYDGIERNLSDASDILEDAEAKFLNLRTSDGIYDLTARMKRIPSSFLVSRDGRIIGDIYEGAGVQELANRLERFLGEPK